VEQRTGPRRPARGVLLLLTMLGLVAMHGLPDTMPGAPGAAAMRWTTSMTSLPHPPTPGVGQGPAPQAEHAGSGTHRVAMPIQVGLGTANLALAAPMGCGMDHAGCVAVLRHARHLAAGGVAFLVAIAPGLATPTTVWTPLRGPRAPPDVSLIELGISRT